jgi:hypothetical protein
MDDKSKLLSKDAWIFFDGFPPIILQAEPDNRVSAVLHAFGFYMIPLLSFGIEMMRSIYIDGRMMVLIEEIRPRIAFRDQFLGMRRKPEIVLVDEIQPFPFQIRLNEIV